MRPARWSALASEESPSCGFSSPVLISVIFLFVSPKSTTKLHFSNVIELSPRLVLRIPELCEELREELREEPHEGPTLSPKIPELREDRRRARSFVGRRAKPTTSSAMVERALPGLLGSPSCFVAMPEPARGSVVCPHPEPLEDE